MASIGQRALTVDGGRPTEVEQAFLGSALADLRGLESRTRGRFAEALIVHTLGEGAHRSTYAAAAWDICWNNRTLAVRTVGQYNSETEWKDDGVPIESSMRWTFPKKSALTVDYEWSKRKRRSWTDAVVLAIHRGFDINASWTFVLLDGKTLDQEQVASLGLRRALALSEHDDELTPEGLRSLLERKFVDGREATRGAEFPVSCDDDIAHHHALSSR